MDELPKEARHLLQAAAAVDDPLPAERNRVDAAVRASLSAYGVHLSPLAPPSSSPTADAAITGAKSAGISGAAAAKVGVAVFTVCIGAWLGLRGYQHGSQPRVSTAAMARATPVAAAPGMRAPETPVAPDRASELSSAAVTAASQPRTSNRTRVEARPRSDAQTPNLDAEVRLIAEADALLRAERFTAALQMLTLHARRFPHGELREERAALRVLSLCGMDRSPRARRERERFLQHARHSVLRARVGAACLEP